MIIVDDFPQLSPEWFDEIRGNPGASKFDQVLTNVKGLPSKSAVGLAMTLAGEIVSGISEDSYSSYDMQRGIIVESDARDRFQAYKDLEVKEVAVCYPDEQKKYHCSPDGIVEDGGGLEIKCPKMKTHVGYLLDNELPDEYIAQVQGSMLVTGFDHWWFMSYYPNLRPLILKIERDEAYIAKLKVELDKLCNMISVYVKKIRNGKL